MFVCAGLLAACSGASGSAVVEIESVAEVSPGASVPALEGVAQTRGGVSLIAFERGLWLFGPTTSLQPDADGRVDRASAWSSTMDFDANDGLGPFEMATDAAGGPAEVLIKTAEELAFEAAGAELEPPARVRLEPLGAARQSLYGPVLVYYAKSRVEGGDGGSGGGAVGSSVAIWNAVELGAQRPVFDPAAAEPTLLFLAPEPAYGLAPTLVDGAVHVWACTDRQVEVPCTLASVPASEAFERDAYRFWTGAGWSEAIDEAASLFDGAERLSVHLNGFVDLWLAFYAKEGVAVVRSAPALTGPWSPEIPVTELEPGAHSVLGHGELRREAGALEYLTYVRPSPEDPAVEELRLLELRLSPN